MRSSGYGLMVVKTTDSAAYAKQITLSASLEFHTVYILGVRAVAWVVNVLGLVVPRGSDDPHELTRLRVPVEVEEDRIAVDAFVDVGAIGATRPAEQTCICG